MSGPIFNSPAAEMADMNHLHYQLQYTKGISQQMQVPETLKVASVKPAGSLLQVEQPLPMHTTLMEVPERIVVAGDRDPLFLHTRDLDLIQSVPLLNMKTPPRVLTLQTASQQSNPSQVAHFQTRPRREHTASENLSCHHSIQISRSDVSVNPSPSARQVRLCPPLCSPEDTNILSYVRSTTWRAYQKVLEVLDGSHRRKQLNLELDINPDESSLSDAASLRRQIVMLNRRLHLLEEENKKRAKRELILYCTTLALWVINTWILFRR